jgi:nitroreductase
MDVMEAIIKRNSVRKYIDREVPKNMVMEILHAARLAPSGMNEQPSRFFIVREDETKRKLRDNDVFKQEFVTKAPVIILCCGNPDVYAKGDRSDRDVNEKRALRDLSIASAFMVLSATEFGLGTCFIGWLDREKIKDVVGIPKSYIVPYVITVGYPAETPKSSPKRSLSDILLGEA